MWGKRYSLCIFQAFAMTCKCRFRWLVGKWRGLCIALGFPWNYQHRVHGSEKQSCLIAEAGTLDVLRRTLIGKNKLTASACLVPWGNSSKPTDEASL